MNTTKGKHTETPWRIAHNESNTRFKVIAMTGTVVAIPHSIGFEKGDVEFIVRAVNNFEALLEACKKISILEEDSSIGHDLLAEVDEVIAQAEKEG